MTNRFTKIAVAASVAGALVVPATQAQAASKTERAILGAVLGGVAGAAIAKNDTAGVAIGAAAGAALGAATAKDKHHRYSRSYRTTRPYAASRYTNGGYYAPQYSTRRYAPSYGYAPSYSRGYYDQYGDYGRY